DWDELRFAVPLRSARLRLGRGLGFGLWFDLVVHRPVDVTAHPAWRDVQLDNRNRRGAPALTHRPFDLRRGHRGCVLGPGAPPRRMALARPAPFPSRIAPHAPHGLARTRAGVYVVGPWRIAADSNQLSPESALQMRGD